MIKQLYKRLKQTNQNGMSMIMILVLLGIFSVMFAAVNRLIFWNRNMYNEIVSTINIDDLNSQIYLLLQDRRACHNTFGGLTKTTPTLAVPNIVNELGVNAFQVNGLYVKNVTIVSMTISNYIYNPVAPPNIEPYIATFDLTVIYRIPFGETGGVKMKPRTFQIRTFAPAGWADGTALSKMSTPRVPDDGCVSAGDLAQLGVDFSDLISKNLPDEKRANLTMNPDLGLPTNSIIRVRGNAILTGLFEISDARYKEEITPYSLSDKQWDKIRGYTFNWKGSKSKDFGFVAQDVEKVLPELVDGTQQDGWKRVSYTAFIPLIMESTKKLDQENKIYEKKIQDLESRVSKIKD